MREGAGVAALLAVAWLGGATFDLLGLPVAWLSGAALATAALSTVSRRAWPLPRTFRTVAQIVLGAAIGLNFPPEAPLLLAKHALPVLLTLLATLGLGVGTGLLLARWAGIDRVTALVASSPGAAGGLVAISEDLGANAFVVATIHYIRVFVIVTLVPFASIYLAKGMAPAATAHVGTGRVATSALVAPNGAFLGAPPTGTGAPVALTILVLLAAGALAGWLLARCGVPSGQFLGPILTALVGRLLGIDVAGIPSWALQLALVLIGASIGSQIDLLTLAQRKRVFLAGTILVGILLVGCVALAFVLHTLTGIDLPTAILALVPGGIDTMIPTALELGADMAWVTVLQTARVLLMILGIPWLVHAASPSPPARVATKRHGA